MKDAASKVRRKLRAVVEIRYPPAPSIFDTRGAIISRIHPRIQNLLPHWRADQGLLVFQDSLEEPKQEFLISVKRSAVLLEDIGSIQEFVDRTEQYFGLLYDELGNALGHIARMGVRIIEICAPRSEPTFEAMNTLVVSRFLTLPRDLTPNVVDSMLRVIHHHGYLHVGPIRAEELWTKTMFRDPASAVPPAGIGLDIDSYQAGIVIKDSADLRRAFIAVFGLTKAVEESALRQLGLLDEQ